MKTDKLQAVLLRFGSTPKRSLKVFIVGLFGFFASLLSVYALSTSPVLQLVCFVIMAIFVLVTLYGYLGILSNRLAMFRHKSAKNKRRFKHIN